MKNIPGHRLTQEYILSSVTLMWLPQKQSCRFYQILSWQKEKKTKNWRNSCDTKTRHSATENRFRPLFYVTLFSARGSRSPTRTLFCDFCTVTPLVVLAVVSYLGHSKKNLIDW